MRAAGALEAWARAAEPRTLPGEAARPSSGVPERLQEVELSGMRPPDSRIDGSGESEPPGLQSLRHGTASQSCRVHKIVCTIVG